jgi:hypothetical protein
MIQKRFEFGSLYIVIYLVFEFCHLGFKQLHSIENIHLTKGDTNGNARFFGKSRGVQGSER